MAIESTRDLFLYELAIMRDGEDDGRRLFDFLALRANDERLVQLFRTLQEEGGRLMKNINSCLQSLGATPIQTLSQSTAGVIERFEVFVRLQPSAGILDQFATDTAIRYAYVCLAGYKTLFDWAILLNESDCVRCLYDNILLKQETASRLEHFSHELGARILTPA